MLKWKIENNVISELFYKDENIIKPWGFETADSSAFFSLEEGIGYRYKLNAKNTKFDSFRNSAELTVTMAEGKWDLISNDKIIKENKLERFVQLTCLEDSYFMDFVLRYRFKKEFIEYAEIYGMKYFHTNSNIYYQYPVEKVILKGINFDIDITIKDATVPFGMKPLMYVRDDKDEWIVHVRMVPEKFNKTVIKLCSAWAKTKSLPQIFSNFILSFPRVKKYLWYKAESNPYSNRIIRRFFNFSAYGLIKFQKGQQLMWYVNFEIKSASS